MIYPKPYSIYLRGTIGICVSLCFGLLLFFKGFRAVGLGALG